MTPENIGPADVQPASLVESGAPISPGQRAGIRRRLIGLAIVGGIVLAGFSQVLRDLLQFSLSDDFFSYIPLIPVVSIYLIWTKRAELHLESEPKRTSAIIPLAVALVLLGAYEWSRMGGWNGKVSDYLAILVGSLIAFIFASCCFFLGPRTLRLIAYPAGFLVFAAPLPAAAYGDRELSAIRVGRCGVPLLAWATGTPVVRAGLDFKLSDITITVAPECSGIHSTFVLLITSVLAAYLFLRTPLRRVLLVVAVLPLALLRNGFRIWVISELCVHGRTRT